MIIMDFSPVILANIMVSLKSLPEINESTIRYMVLQSIAFYRKKFGNEYGQLVIAVDSRSWRKDAFPYYKYSRAVHKENDSKLDWDLIFTTMDTIVGELETYFPYNVLSVPGAEADDIIGTLAHHFGVDMNFGNFEPMVILSSDHDFIQLHKYTNLKQFAPREKKFIKHADPDDYLLEQIIKGDKGDGVPNILSSDDIFTIEGSRQKSISAKFLAEVKANPDSLSSEVRRNFDRNKLMIDLTQTPQTIKDAIIDKYLTNATTIKESRDYGTRVMNYMSKHRLRKFLDNMKVFL